MLSQFSGVLSHRHHTSAGRAGWQVRWGKKSGIQSESAALGQRTTALEICACRVALASVSIVACGRALLGGFARTGPSNTPDSCRTIPTSPGTCSKMHSARQWPRWLFGEIHHRLEELARQCDNDHHRANSETTGPLALLLPLNVPRTRQRTASISLAFVHAPLPGCGSLQRPCVKRLLNGLFSWLPRRQSQACCKQTQEAWLAPENQCAGRSAATSMATMLMAKETKKAR